MQNTQKIQLAKQFVPEQANYYLVFDSPNVFRVFFDTDAVMNNTEAFFIVKVPEQFQENFKPENYNIALSRDKQLLISRKPIPFAELQKQKRQDAYHYGNSEEIDCNFFGGRKISIDAITRMKIQERVMRAKQKGKDQDTLHLGAFRVNLPIRLIEDMLGAIVDRAIENYEILQRHLANIDNLSLPEELAEYDYKAGYKAPLSFDIPNS